MKQEFKVSVELKEGEVSYTELTDHIRTAMKQWGGQYHPDEPLFSANIKRVMVRSLPKK